MDDGDWGPDALAALNAELDGAGIRVGAPEPDGDGRWRVRIDCADEPTEIIEGPTAEAVWASARAWIRSATGQRPWSDGGPAA
jgi:hypothetical protein